MWITVSTHINEKQIQSETFLNVLPLWKNVFILLLQDFVLVLRYFSHSAGSLSNRFLILMLILSQILLYLLAIYQLPLKKSRVYFSQKLLRVLSFSEELYTTVWFYLHLYNQQSIYIFLCWSKPSYRKIFY